MGATSTEPSASTGPHGRHQPQTERQNDFMAGQHGLPFPVLSDPGCALGEKFGLVYTVPNTTSTTFAPSSSISPSSTANPAGVFPCRQPMS